LERYFLETPSESDIIFGLKLDRIPKGDITIVINAHGNSEGIISRSIEEIAEHINIIDRATGEGSVVRKVSLIACNLGRKFF
jgi:hypothetical protein